jgi:glycine/D-amino acid oxidase-like deaminating enzyme
MKYDVIVVGAGITGAATAYFLKKRGAKDVLLLERDQPAAGGTGKSAAIIRQHYSVPIGSNLTRESIGLLKGLTEAGFRSGLAQTGWHMLISEEMLEGTRATVEQVKSLGIATEFTDLASSRLAELVAPEGVVGVVYEPDGGYADPVHATEAFVAAFQALGGEFRSKTPVRALVGDSKRVTGVELEAESLEAGVVVNASGPWAGKLGESVGLDMPLRVVREQDSVWEIRPGRDAQAARSRKGRSRTRSTWSMRGRSAIAVSWSGAAFPSRTSMWIPTTTSSRPTKSSSAISWSGWSGAIPGSRAPRESTPMPRSMMRPLIGIPSPVPGPG